MLYVHYYNSYNIEKHTGRKQYSEGKIAIKEGRGKALACARVSSIRIVSIAIRAFSGILDLMNDLSQQVLLGAPRQSREPERSPSLRRGSRT